jgi:hypothetical protein
MMRRRTWTVEINIIEHEDGRRTHADATLRDVRPLVRGQGDALRRASDQEFPEIGDELATARALADLAYKVLDGTVDDLDPFTRRPVRLLS